MADRLINIAELSEWLQIPVATIYGWRHKGVGPAAVKCQGSVRWRVETVNRWIEENESGPRLSATDRASAPTRKVST